MKVESEPTGSETAIATGLPRLLIEALEASDFIGACPIGVLFRNRVSEVWQALVCEAGRERECWRLAPVLVDGVCVTILDGGPSWCFWEGLFQQIFGLVIPFDAVWFWQCGQQCWLLQSDGSWTPTSPAERPQTPLPAGMAVLDFACLEAPALRKISSDNDCEWFTTNNWDPALYAAAARAGMISISWQPGLDTWLLAQLQTEYAVLDWRDRHLPRRLRQQIHRLDPRLTGANLVLTTHISPVIAGIRQRFGADCWVRPPYAQLIESLIQKPQLGCQPIAAELRGPNGELWAGELGYALGRSYTCLTGFVAAEAPAGISWGLVQILALSEILYQQGFAFMNMGHAQMPYKLALGAKVLPRADFLGRWNDALDHALSEPPCSSFLGEELDSVKKSWPVCELLRTILEHNY